MGKTKVFLCSEEETVEIGKARVTLEAATPEGRGGIRHTDVILRDVDFPAESAADAAVTALQADVEFYQKNSDYWHKTYSLLMEQRRRDWSERVDLVAQNDELRSEVERLKQSRKEQAEKHRQKMRNLQQNFEQQANGKTMNSKLRRELQASKDYAQTLRKTVDRQTSEINSLKSKYYRQSFELDVRVKEIKGLQAKLDRERGNDSYWHEKYLESEKVVADLSESRKEQAEKHKQKMRNLQQNFEAREQAKNRNTKLQRQVKNLTRALETSRADAEYWHGRFIEVEDSLNDPSELAHSWRRLDQQRIDLASENKKLRQKHDYLVDALNAISHTVNDAAERQDGGGL